jgi:hypothetical protein
MSRHWIFLTTVAAALLAVQAPLLAHHSFTAEFDAKKPITLKGTVTKLAWTNPHAHIKVDVKDDAGKVTNWDFELGSPNWLLRRGWTARTLKAGDEITVSGYLARDGSPLANARAVTLADGREVFAGSSSEDSATQ